MIRSRDSHTSSLLRHNLSSSYIARIRREADYLDNLGCRTINVGKQRIGVNNFSISEFAQRSARTLRAIQHPVPKKSR